MKELYCIHSDMCKVFSNPTRLEILDILRNKEMMEAVRESDEAKKKGIKTWELKY